MPATLTYPGVYIEEIPSGVRTIIGVALSALEPDAEYEIVARIWNKRLPKSTLAMPAFFFMSRSVRFRRLTIPLRKH